MRIIAGSLKGRIIAETSGHRTHPMGEKIRGAIFNALGDLEGLRVLDAFTGTGAVAIEAVSRGADYVLGVDIDKNAYTTARKNVADLQLLEKIDIVMGNNTGWLQRHPTIGLFDVVILDPPYDDIDRVALNKLASHTKPGGILVVSITSMEKISFSPSGFMQVKESIYAGAKILFYEKQ
jgi:16S rRNA (guanine966-N2)-methyltransferase